MDADERREMVLQCFAKYFGERALQPAEYIEQNWAEEEFSRGCYGGRMGTGVWTRYAQSLSEPVGPHPLGRHRDGRRLERLHGRRGPLRRARRRGGAHRAGRDDGGGVTMALDTDIAGNTDTLDRAVRELRERGAGLGPHPARGPPRPAARARRGRLPRGGALGRGGLSRQGARSRPRRSSARSGSPGPGRCCRPSARSPGRCDALASGDEPAGRVRHRRGAGRAQRRSRSCRTGCSTACCSPATRASVWMQPGVSPDGPGDGRPDSALPRTRAASRSSWAPATSPRSRRSTCSTSCTPRTASRS